jgi:hypothetical protein
MHSDLDLVITHDGMKWIAGNGELTASGRSLPELDADLAAALRRAGYAAGSRLRVFMGFDMRTLPEWTRQYAPHYFNRFVDVEV